MAVVFSTFFLDETLRQAQDGAKKSRSAQTAPRVGSPAHSTPPLPWFLITIGGSLRVYPSQRWGFRVSKIDRAVRVTNGRRCISRPGVVSKVRQEGQGRDIRRWTSPLMILHC